MREIDKLNEEVWCKLAPSQIHGVGVFAIRDIKEGQKLYCQSLGSKFITIPYEKFNEILPEIKEMIEQRWPLVKDGSPFLSPNDDARLISFMNNGKEESNYDAYTDLALKDIPAGTEVLEDYDKL